MMFSSISSDLDPSNWQQPQQEGFNWPNLHHANIIVHPNNPSTLLPPQPPPPATTTPMGRPGPIPRPIPMAVKCPRCESTNTKFCYYNNRSFSQPRHWCRSCRRHWTHGGALRTVPIGGTRRKSKRSKSSTSSSGASSSATPAPMQGLTNYNEHSRVLVPPELPPPRFPSGFEAELSTFEIGHVIGLNEMEEIAQVDGEFANAYFTC